MDFKRVIKKITFLFLLLVSTSMVGQEAMVKMEKDKAPATSRAQRKKAKQKWKETRKLEMDQKKAVKDHHKRLQNKDTRKRMKREKKKSERLRTNKRQSFFSRMFG